MPCAMKPPKKWLEKKRPEVRRGLRKAHPDWSKQKLNQETKETLGHIWYHEMDSNQRYEVLRKYGKIRR